jgi:hypothetical protein
MSANRRRADLTKPKRKAPRTAWKPGQSGNPKGAPKRGESWAETVKVVGDMLPSEAVDLCRSIARQVEPLGDNATMRTLVVLRVFTALLFEPSAALLSAVMGQEQVADLEARLAELERRMGVRPDAPA